MNYVASYTVRPARFEDSRFVFNLTQDPRIREWSTRSQEYTWEQHEQWWVRRFREPATKMWILELGTYLPIAYVRYGRVVPDEFHDQTRHEAEVSIAADPQHWGSGHAAHLLDATGPLVPLWLQVNRLVALIVVGNVRSLKLFRKCGYIDTGTEERMGKGHVRLEKMV